VTGAVCDAPVDYGDPAIWTAQVGPLATSFVIEVERSRTAVAGTAGGRPPLLYRRGDAGVLPPRCSAR
jgi:hypothetical protein